MVNRKIVLGVTLSVVFAAVAAFPVRAGAEEQGSAVPALEDILSCQASPAEPAPDTASQATPSSDLFNPEPTYVCYTGWCSSDAQCVEWYGEGSTCSKRNGATCGLCT